MASNHAYSGIAALGNIKAKARCHSYEQYDDFLGDKRDSAYIAANTRVDRENPRCWCGCGPVIYVVLYYSPILCYYRDDTFWADNNGFNTLTTKNRLDQFGPHGVSFWHHKSELRCTRGPCGRGIRYPVYREYPDSPPAPAVVVPAPALLPVWEPPVIVDPLARKRRTVRFVG